MSEEKVYPIHKDLESRTHIRNDQYVAMYQASIERPEEFWNQKADEFLTWIKPWDKLTESDFTKGEVKWFIGAELNATESALQLNTS